MGYFDDTPRVSTAFTYRGIDAAVLENDHIRVLVLPGKGGDILEFRDKRTDVDVLWHADHGWQPPNQRTLPGGTDTTWLDQYPGGWQVNLPIAGDGMSFDGGEYGLHGESALLPWNAQITRDDEAAITLSLDVELVRYPFHVERDLTVRADAPALEISESITNRGGIAREFVWQQHIALGEPLLSPAARLDVPASRGITETTGAPFENGRLADEESFDWPYAPTRDGATTDLREIPPSSAELHDQAYATDLEAGWFALTNPEVNLGFAVTFPQDLFECLWYWQPLGGFEQAPYHGRNYNVGIEPTTAYPLGGLPDKQRANGTMKSLAPGETVTASFTAQTYGGVERVNDVSPETGIDGD